MIRYQSFGGGVATPGLFIQIVSQSEPVHAIPFVHELDRRNDTLAACAITYGFAKSRPPPQKKLHLIKNPPLTVIRHPPLARYPLGIHPPDRDTPGQTPPGQTPLPWATTPRHTPPGTHPQAHTPRHTPPIWVHAPHLGTRPRQTLLWAHPPLWADTHTPPGRPPPQEMATAADGTHPTGMHSITICRDHL